MIKERILWLILRDLENRKTDESAILVGEWIETALGSGKFENATSVERMIEGLSKENHVLEAAEQLRANTWVAAYSTNPASDKYFKFQYFWPKVIDQIGFWKVLSALGTIATILALFMPNGLAYKFLVNVYGSSNNIAVATNGTTMQSQFQEGSFPNNSGAVVFGDDNVTTVTVKKYPPPFVAKTQRVGVSAVEGKKFRTKFLIEIEGTPGVNVAGNLVPSVEAICSSIINQNWSGTDTVSGMHVQGVDVSCLSPSPMPEDTTFTFTPNSN